MGPFSTSVPGALRLADRLIGIIRRGANHIFLAFYVFSVQLPLWQLHVDSAYAQAGAFLFFPSGNE